MPQRLPTVAAVEHLVEALEALGRSPRHKVTPANAADRTMLAGIRRRLLGTEKRPGAIRREAHGTNLPDGYPARTLGEGLPNGTAELTSVEAAAHRLMKPPRDEHRELTLRATTALDHAVTALNTLMSALASLDDLTDEDLGPQPRTCDACHPWRDIIATVTHPNTSVGERLDEPIDLCEACYDFVRNIGRPPNEAEIARHEERGRWRVRLGVVAS